MKKICNPTAPEPVVKKLFYKGQTLFECIHTATVKDPVYSIDGIIHYVVDHTAFLFWETTTIDYEELKEYGIKMANINSRFSDKCYHEELIIFSQAIKGGTKYPIPL